MAGIDEGQGQVAHRPRPRRGARLGAVGALSSMAWLTERATNFDPDPSGVAAIGAEDEAAGENDGSGGVDWGYW